MERTRHYSSDKPIRCKTEDLLGRVKFAEQLSRDLQTWSGEDSLVVALYGAWGSGKTSLKNLILEANLRKPSRALPVMEFNPWRLSGTGSIRTFFFREFRLALENNGSKKDVANRARRLDAYAASLALLGSTIDVVGKSFHFFGVPGGPAVEAAGQSVKSIAGVTKQGGEALTSKGAVVKSLEDQKRELSELLRKLPKPMLIVIDDIDRLTTEEILQIFQLVKANADFPNVIYLLLFEREIVVSALHTVSGGRGNEFLEKIIQVGYHIPYASQDSIERVLFKGLDSYVDQKPLSLLWEKARWNNIYLDGLRAYFKNLRHVYRFLASFGFHARHHRTGSSFEVNPIDLIALETLRVFEPSVYENLSSAKSLLTRSGFLAQFGFDSSVDKQEVIDHAIAQVISIVSEERRGAVKNIIQHLFPSATSQFASKDVIAHSSQKWFRQRRICQPEIFDKYFTLAIAEGDLSQAEIDCFLGATGDVEKFVLNCKALEVRSLLKKAFQRLDAYKEEIPLENMPSLIEGLCRISDEFPEREPVLSGRGVDVYAWRLVYFGLKREPDPAVRLRILKTAFLNSKNLALPIEIVSLEDDEEKRAEPGSELLVDDEGLKQLKTICVDKLRIASNTTQFLRAPRLLQFLWRWSDWSSESEVRSWLSDRTKDEKGAVWLLSLLLSTTHSYGATHLIQYHIALEAVEKFSDVNMLRQLVQNVDADKLPQRDGIALREFRKALKRREDGRSDDAGRREGFEVEADE